MAGKACSSQTLITILCHGEMRWRLFAAKQIVYHQVRVCKSLAWGMCPQKYD